MGAAMVAFLAATRATKAVIMESPYSSVAEMDFVAGRCLAYGMDNAKLDADISTPTLIIHGAENEIITPDHVDRIGENLGAGVKEKHILEGGGHGDLKGRKEYVVLIQRFIQGLF